MMAKPPRLRAEALVPAHADALFDDLRDPALYAFIPDEPPASLGELAARYEHLSAGAPAGRDEIWLNWALFDASDGRPVGTLQATIYRDARAAIAYTIVARRWRQGLGREAVAWLLEHLAARGVTTIEARIDTRNKASIRLVEGLGFRRERTIVAADHFKGSSSDEHVYQRRVSAEA